MKIKVRYNPPRHPPAVQSAQKSDPPYILRPVPAATQYNLTYHVEQLRLGTIEVRKALDASITVTDAQIQEALWHYYFEVEKSVSYLKSMRSWSA